MLLEWDTAYIANLNFNMLGAVVEKISGVRYDRYVSRTY